MQFFTKMNVDVIHFFRMKIKLFKISIRTFIQCSIMCIVFLPADAFNTRFKFVKKNSLLHDVKVFGWFVGCVYKCNCSGSGEEGG